MPNITDEPSTFTARPAANKETFCLVLSIHKIQSIHGGLACGGMMMVNREWYSRNLMFHTVDLASTQGKATNHLHS